MACHDMAIGDLKMYEYLNRLITKRRDPLHSRYIATQLSPGAMARNW